MESATLPPMAAADVETLFRPAENREGYWVGAPCVHAHGGTDYLAVRERNPAARGHTISIYESALNPPADPVVSLAAADLGVESLERAAMTTDPDTGDLKLYLSVDHGAYDWTIQKLDDVASPEQFDPTTARDVLRPEPETSDAYTVKDPYLLRHDGHFYMYYAGYDGRSEQAHLATSPDGEVWTRPSANPVLPCQHWHDHLTRISCVLPEPNGSAWLVVYEGSGSTDYEPDWNLRTGQALSVDLTSMTDTCTTGPVYASPTTDRITGLDRLGTFRYLDVLERDGRWFLFYEAAREDGSFELRRARVDVDG